LDAAKLPEYEIRPNVSSVSFENSLGLRSGYTYGADFAKKINKDFMANFSFKRRVLDYQTGVNASTFTNIYGLNAEYYYFEEGDMQSYLTAGLSYVNPQDKYLDVDNMFGINYGVGIKYLINEDAGLFAEIKHLTTFDDDENQLVSSVGVLIPFGYEKEKEPAKPVIAAPEKEEIIPKDEFVFLDDDKDGVVNEMDKCPNTDPKYEVNEEGCKIHYTLLVNFEYDSAKLTKDSYKVIEEFALFMDEPKKLNAEIQGHTDSRGSDEYNQDLSERRAKSVYNALINYGISKDRLKYVGFGEKQPLVEEDGTESTYFQNRRVEAVILKK
jgi:OOP family OmpA-OmpF porin